MKLTKAIVRRKPFTAFPDGGHVRHVRINKTKTKVGFSE